MSTDGDDPRRSGAECCVKPVAKSSTKTFLRKRNFDPEFTFLHVSADYSQTPLLLEYQQNPPI